MYYGILNATTRTPTGLDCAFIAAEIRQIYRLYRTGKLILIGSNTIGIEQQMVIWIQKRKLEIKENQSQKNRTGLSQGIK